MKVAPIIVLLVACGGVGDPPPGQPKRPQELSPLEVQARAAMGLRAGETIASAVAHQAPGLVQTVVQVVVESEGDSRAYVVDADGHIELTQEFWERERTARLARFGTLTPALFEEVSQLAGADVVEVDITVIADLPEPQLPFDGTDQLVPIDVFEAWTRAHADAQVARIVAAKSRILDFLRDHSVEILANPRALPTIRARVPATLLTSPELGVDVVQIDTVSHEAVELLGYAGHASMNAVPSAGGLSGGLCGGACDGGLIDVGLWEGFAAGGSSNNPVAIARNNIRVSTGNTVTGYFECPKACSSDTDCPSVSGFQQRCREPAVGQPKVCVGDHLTWVAASVGMFGSYAYDTTTPGGSPDNTPNVPMGTTFSSAGAWHVDHRVGNADGTDGLDYLVAPCCGQTGCPECKACEFSGAPPTPYVNRSESSTPLQANFVGRAFGTFVTAGSGNFNDGTVQCALLRNGLCVGMFDYATFSDQATHRRTNAPGNLGSAFINNPNVAELERPHLLGPGNHSNTSGLHMPSIDVPPGTNGMRFADHEFPAHGITGTSFAAPAVLSAAIQAHQFEGWFSTLSYPMVNKAVLLSATRDSNNDGAIGKFNVWSQNAPSVDAEDGAGQINFAALKATLENNRYVFRDLANSDLVSCGTNCKKYAVTTVNILAGDRIRVALAWQVCQASPGSPVSLNDLDLALNCGSPVVACGGTTISNTIPSELEMLERPACPNNKTCTIEIRTKNGASLAPCGSTVTERVGVAWSFSQ